VHIGDPRLHVRQLGQARSRQLDLALAGVDTRQRSAIRRERGRRRTIARPDIEDITELQ